MPMVINLKKRINVSCCWVSKMVFSNSMGGLTFPPASTLLATMTILQTRLPLGFTSSSFRSLIRAYTGESGVSGVRSGLKRVSQDFQESNQGFYCSQEFQESD
jgi:hypothetical protein